MDSNTVNPADVSTADVSPADIAYLRSPIAIRDRCRQLFELAQADKLHYFRPNLDQLPAVADYVIQVTREAYPDLDIPFHSRWRHFEVGGNSRLNDLEQKLAGMQPLEIAQAKFDLAIVSVLLDAGAGADWQYQEAQTGQTFRRSEGLAVASFQMFCQGRFSSNPTVPLQADATGLQQLTATTLNQGFQVSSTNPLVGVKGRVDLLQQLGKTLQQHPRLFSSENSSSENPSSDLSSGNSRPGYLVNYLLQQTQNGQLPASVVLGAVLEGLGDIWSGRLILKGVNLGDVWMHSALATHPPSETTASLFPTLVPFHKLSQWLTYSLLEPLEELGIQITGLDELTGLPEYRNGGLCLDLGLLQVKDPIVLQQTQAPGDEAIVEWRALTVILLDYIADAIRQQLDLIADQLPLVKVLQGGTWTAGRRIAAKLRPGGVPPIQINSDGTVF